MVTLSTKLARIRSETHEQVTELADREGISFAEALEQVVRREGETADATPPESEANGPIEYEELPQDEESSSFGSIAVAVIGGLIGLTLLTRR